MKNLTLILVLLLPVNILAQMASPHVLSSAGDQFENVSTSISYTVGETNIITLTAGDFVLLQGFQQPGDEATSIPDMEEMKLKLRTWPNPVKDLLYLQIDSEVSTDLVVEIFDILGRIQHISKFESPLQPDPYSIDMSEDRSGMYILKIRAADRSVSEVIRIRKE